MTAILVAAFKFEAYMNHVGAVVFPYWSELERLPHRSKLNIICEHSGLRRSDSERPFQTITELFRFRNELAHGKSGFLEPPESVEVGNIEELRRKKPLTAWERLCTPEFAKRAYEDTNELMAIIHRAVGLNEYDLIIHPGHSYVLKDVERVE